MGKNKVVAYHRQVPYRVLERIPEKSVLDSRGSDCGNMVIHGDNLEALKALLPEYEGKVDCIYIDPPYNTGNVDELKDVDLMSEEGASAVLLDSSLIPSPPIMPQDRARVDDP